MSNEKPIKISENTDLISSVKCTLFPELERRFNWFTGSVLTLVDATIIDPVQRKAFKDLLKTKIMEFQFDQVNATVSNALEIIAGCIGDYVPPPAPPSMQARYITFITELEKPVGFKYSREEI